MDPNHLFPGHRQETQGVIIEQIMPCGEGKLSEIVQASYCRRLDILIIQCFMVERHMPIHTLDRCLQTLELQSTPLLNRHIVALGDLLVPCHKEPPSL